jgi:integrase
MNILDDPKMKLFFTKRKNINEKRKLTYETVFNEFYKLFGLTPSEMIKEAKKQQIPDWEKKIFIDIDDRNITRYLNEYYQYLEKAKKNKQSSIKVKIGIIRSFYNQFNIKLPKADVFTEHRSRTRKTDIPTWDDVKYVVEKLESKKYIALVYFFATSGIRSGDVCNLTIKDFLEATKKYHDGTLENLLSKDPYEYSIRPAWDFDPEKTDYNGNICFTSNTPQAVKALFSYLEQRTIDGYPVDNNSPLFRTRKERLANKSKSFFYDSNSMSDLFRNTINPLFDIKDDDGNIITRSDKLGYTFFRPHNLRKLFKTTCGSHMPKVMFEVEEKSNFVKDIDILSLLTGHDPINPKITKTYEAVSHDDIAPYYFHMIPYLTIGEIKAKDAHTDEYIEMRDRINKLEEEKNEDLKWIREFRKKYGDNVIENILNYSD